MKKRKPFCLVKHATLRCADFVCLCGWPDKPCVMLHPDMRLPPNPYVLLNCETTGTS